jgi:hypothetical protein
MTELEQQRALILGALAETPDVLSKVLSLEKEFKAQVEDFIADKGEKEGIMAVALVYISLAEKL